MTAIQNRPDINSEVSSSDNSASDFLEQSSSFTSFCSALSHHSNTRCDDQMIPTSIFLDDDVNKNDIQNDIPPVLEDSDEEQFSVIDIANIDGILNSRQVPTRADSSSIDYDDITDGSTTSSLESINDTLHDDTPYYHHHSGQYEHHGFEQVTNNETASYKIMSLLDTAGAPRICYDRLVALLKKLSKGGFDVKKAVNRDTLMRRLERKNTARPQIQSSIINKQEVVRFRFQDMLQDLIHSSTQHLHAIVPPDPWN